MIAYEILTGERPFTGEHLSTVIFKIVGEEQQPAHRINGTLTQQIDDVLRKGLAKKPENRYVNCSAFVGALERHRVDLGTLYANPEAHPALAEIAERLVDLDAGILRWQRARSQRERRGLEPERGVFFRSLWSAREGLFKKG